MLLLLPMFAMAQTKGAVAPIKVLGIPLGITAKEFKAQSDALREKLPEILGTKDARVSYNMYEGAKDDDIIWQATIIVEKEYVSPSNIGFRITSMLSAKYGAPVTVTHIDYGDCLRWNLKNGYIQAWYKGRSFYAQYVDYNAIKKALPELNKFL